MAAVERRQRTASRLNRSRPSTDVGLSGPVEPFNQLVENGVGTGEGYNLFGRCEDVQFSERRLHLCVANDALPSQKRAHRSKLEMKRHHVCRKRADSINQIGKGLAGPRQIG